MKKIQTFNISRLLTGAHYEFHSNTLAQIEAATPAALKVEEYYDEYKANVEMLGANLVKKRGLPKTTELHAIDRKRDVLLRHLLKSMKDLVRSSDPDMKKAGEEAWEVLKSYVGSGKYEMEKQTAWVESILKAIDDNDLGATIGRYAGSQVIYDLADANNEFKKIMDERWEAMGKIKSKKVDLKKLRERTNEIYREMCFIINIWSNGPSSQVFNDFIEKHNGMIDNFKRIIKGMRRGGSGNEELPPEETQSDIILYA